MKIFHLTIIIFSFALVSILSNTAFGSEPCPASGYIHYGPSRQSIPCYLAPPPSNPTLEEQLGNTKKTQVEYDGTQLIVNQVVDKLEYKIGETIHVTPELVNIGNKTVDVFYHSMLSYTEVTSLNASKVWPPWEIGFIPEFTANATLKPGIPFIGKLMQDTYPIILDAPGKYSITSVAIFYDQANTQPNHDEFVWSKPIQITVLPEKMSDNQNTVQTGSTPTNQITKIISLDDFRKTIASKYAHTDDWQHVVRLRSLSWAQDNKTIIIKTDNSFAGPNLWSLRMDGTELQSISLNDTVMKNLRYPPNQLGNMTVSVPQCDKCPSFGIILGTVDNNYQHVLYNGDSTPEYPAISSDGKYIVFAYDVNSSWDKPEENGIYVITLGKPIPEFPFTIPVFLVSIASLIVFYRMKIRK